MSRGSVKDSYYTLHYNNITAHNYKIHSHNWIRLAVTNPLTVRSLNRSTIFKYLQKHSVLNVTYIILYAQLVEKQ